VGEARFCFLLHSHMPYVRRNGDWPCGEEWILEAWAESYLPIWGLMEDLSSAAAAGKLALTVTPVLAEQLQDRFLQERLDGYLENKIRQAREEVERLKGMGDEPRARLASFYAQRYGALLEDFRQRFRGRMLEIPRQAMQSGRLEILASAATHAMLPSLGPDACRRAQIAIGLEGYRRCFGRDPAGFWLPECAYTPELDTVLGEFSPPLEYVILDYSAVGAPPGEARTWEPRRLGTTSLVALIRDEPAHSLVWAWDGIPSHSPYRETSKRDWQGHGYQYWRVTSLDTPLDRKELYDPDAAGEEARKDARGFAARLRERVKEIKNDSERSASPTILLAAYDTELFGHWWMEGPEWLREVLGLLGEECELPSLVAEQASSFELASLSPSLTAWNAGGSFDTWINPSTRDIWEKVHRAEEDFLAVVEARALKNPQEERVLGQAARELLIAEASDWTYMITRGQASAYARDRLERHLERFASLMDMLRCGNIDREALSILEETDNLFSWLSTHHWKI
jgi:1,4-alpha-glucan branching enzyme